jgi:hypothetical protein
VLAGIYQFTVQIAGKKLGTKENFLLTIYSSIANFFGPLQTELTLEKYIPSHLLPTAHHWLILHGRYVCTARAPKCAECGVSTWCRKYAEDNKRSKTE